MYRHVIAAGSLLLAMGCNSGGEAPPPGPETPAEPMPSTGPTGAPTEQPPAEAEPVELATRLSDPSQAPWNTAEFSPVFSLVDNRHLLHRYDTGLFVNFGAPSGLKYVYGHWTGS